MQPGEIVTLQTEDEVTKDPTHCDSIPRMLSSDTFKQFFFFSLYDAFWSYSPQ